ncbi:DOMON domain-containing protein [Paucibacter sp. XJ19-41]|uniref:DOMON domain-containing protein n=1 Tax=Paucibacter sp. XJ19-41 TaxID=2927824 RepID=UPI0023499885|nr:DOMON domain-containing protein [Paucibacter sp. XJ19-41]MDC6167078.1 DOMON domain-containing protein [Paucibacter sp. XJ19-41]
MKKSSLTRALTLGVTAGLLAAGSGMAMGACGPDTTFAPNDDYALTFKICDNSFVGTVTAKATGWVAVGFSRSTYMPGSDVFMAGVLPDGTAYGNDSFADMRSPPVVDASQDVTLLGAAEANGVTSYSFSRPLKTGDAADFDLTDGPYYLLWAFNQGSDSLTSRHTSAAASDLPYLFAPVPEASTLLMLLAGLGLLAGRLRRDGGMSAG